MKAITTFSCSHTRVLVFSCVILLYCLQAAYTQSVISDLTFGQNGMTVTSSDWGRGNTVVFDKLGNIITTVISDSLKVVIVKMNADGIIDENFGTNGQILVSEVPNSFSPEELKITNENKILLLGTL